MNFKLTIRQVMGCYLALALLMVPLFGLMHGVVHGLSSVDVNPSAHLHTQLRMSAGGPAQDQVRAQTDDDDFRMSLSPTSSRNGWSKALFAGHGKAADCLVFDQLCHAQALHFLPLQALPTLLPHVVLVTLAGDFIARWAALFQARGPPSAR